METRKIQEVGSGTFTVSLPKEWATDYELEAGMEIRLYSHRDGSILLRSSAADVEYLKDAVVEIDGDDTDAAARAVRTAHMVGFETITLRSRGTFTDSERKAVQSTVRELVGTNILTESDSEITVGHLLDTASASVRPSVIQLQYVVSSLLGDAVEAFADAADTQPGVRDRAAEARRSAEMITRHFSRSLISYAEIDMLGVSRPELFAYYEIARHLETVTDQAVRIAKAGEKLPEPPSEAATGDVRSVVEDVACAVDDAATAVLNGEMTTVRRARDRSDQAMDRIETTEQRLYDGSLSESVSTAVALATTLTHLRRAANCSCSMADTAARTAIRAENIDI